MQIAVISMETSRQRRECMQAQLAELDLAWHFHPGTVVRQFPPEYDHAARRRWFGFDLAWGEIGCLLSHRAVWERCLASGDACWCVLEDDIEIRPGFAAALAALERSAQAATPPWDLVRLMQLLPRRGWRQYSLPALAALPTIDALGPQRGRGRSAPLAPEETREWRLMAYHRQPGGTHGYVITPRGARRLLEYTRRIWEPVDNTIDSYWRHGLDVFCLEPAVIAPRHEAPSEIGARGRGRRPFWPGVRRDAVKGLGLPRRMWHNYRRYGRAWARRREA